MTLEERLAQMQQGNGQGQQQGGQPGAGEPGNGTPAPAAQGAGQGDGGAAGQSQGFQLPEKFQGKSPEDIARAYVELESRLGELGPRAKIAEQIDQYGGLDNLLGWVRYGQQIAQQLQQQQGQEPQQRQQPQGRQQADDPWAQYDLLEPREQAERIREVVAREVLAGVQQLAQNYQRQIQDWQQQQVQQWQLYRNALDLWRKNPDVEPETVMTEALKLAQGGGTDLLSLAAKTLTSDKEIQKQAKALFEAWKQDEQQKAQNAQTHLVSQQVGGRSRFQNPQFPSTRQEENTSLARKFIEQGLISPGQL